MAACNPERSMREKAAKAYYRAETRGFQPGGEAQDWLAAETEILARLRGGNGIL